MKLSDKLMEGSGIKLQIGCLMLNIEKLFLI